MARHEGLDGCDDRQIGWYLEEYGYIRGAQIVRDEHWARIIASVLCQGEIEIEGLYPPVDHRTLGNEFNLALEDGAVPGWLSSRETFGRYYQEIAATDYLKSPKRGLFAAKIARKIPALKRRAFEQAVGQGFTWFLEAQPQAYEQIYDAAIEANRVISDDSICRAQRRLLGLSGITLAEITGPSGLILDISPGVSGSMQRVQNCQDGIWRRAVLLAGDYFTETVGRYFAKRESLESMLDIRSGGVLSAIGELQKEDVIQDKGSVRGLGFDLVIIHRADMIRHADNPYEMLRGTYSMQGAGGLLWVAGATRPEYADFCGVDDVLAGARSAYGEPSPYGYFDWGGAKEVLFVKSPRSAIIPREV